MRVLIVGCGYVGLPLAAALARQGHQVSGLRRSADGAAALTAGGVTPLLGDITEPDSLAKISPQFDWVVNCVSSSHGGAEDYRRVYLEGAEFSDVAFDFVPLLVMAAITLPLSAWLFRNRLS